MDAHRSGDPVCLWSRSGKGELSSDFADQIAFEIVGETERTKELERARQTWTCKLPLS